MVFFDEKLGHQAILSNIIYYMLYILYYQILNIILYYQTYNYIIQLSFLNIESKFQEIKIRIYVALFFIDVHLQSTTCRQDKLDIVICIYIYMYKGMKYNS